MSYTLIDKLHIKNIVADRVDELKWLLGDKDFEETYKHLKGHNKDLNGFNLNYKEIAITISKTSKGYCEIKPQMVEFYQPNGLYAICNTRVEPMEIHYV